MISAAERRRGRSRAEGTCRGLSSGDVAGGEDGVEQRWRQIRKDTGLDWVTPHTFRKTVATLISERVDSDTASQQLGRSSSSITREFYIAKPAIAADVAHVLQLLAVEGQD